MSVEQTKALVQRWISVWNRNEVDAVEAFVTSDYVRHDPNNPTVEGVAAEKSVMGMYHAAFPDLELTVDDDDIVVGDNRVAFRFTVRGTHQGQLMRVPATGKQIMVQGMEMWRLAGGRIAVAWILLDVMTLLQQLGAVSLPEDV